MKTIRLVTRDNFASMAFDLDINDVETVHKLGQTVILVAYKNGSKSRYDIGIDAWRRVEAWLTANGRRATAWGEHLTLAAARMLGRDMSGFVWRDDVNGMVRAEIAPTLCPQTFAPLSDPGDAFLLEATLDVGVSYRYNGGAHIAIHVECVRHPDLHHAVTVPANDVAGKVVARMLAVTTMAHLMECVENMACRATSN